MFKCFLMVLKILAIHAVVSESDSRHVFPIMKDRVEISITAHKKISKKMKLGLDKVFLINDNGYHYCYHTGEIQRIDLFNDLLLSLFFFDSRRY